MPREIKVTLGETEFTVPALNIAQLQDISEIIAAGVPTTSAGFTILKVAMKRATPAPDWDSLGPTLDEISDAVQTILKLSGLQKPDANPQLTVVGGTE